MNSENELENKVFEAQTALSRLLPDGFFASAIEIGDYSTMLSPQEAKTAKNYRPKRLNEYSTGRYLAKQILAGIGIDCPQILKLPSGCPDWQGKVRGSISHSDICICAITLSQKVKSVGIDIELKGRLNPEESRFFMGEEELQQAKFFAEKHLQGDLDTAITIAFSIREAAYKALNPVYGQGIDYETITVDFAASQDGLLLLQLQNTQIPSSLICRFTAVNNQVITAAVLQKADRDNFAADCCSSAEFKAVV